MAKLFQK